VQTAPADAGDLEAAKATMNAAMAKAAAAPVQEANRKIEPTTFATIYVQADGKRYAVLDYRAADAPKSQRVVSGAWFKQYGLEYIDTIHRPAEAPPLNLKGPYSKSPAPADDVDGGAHADSNDYNNPWSWPKQFYTQSPANFAGWREDLSRYNQYLRSGPIRGCENATNRTRNCTHATTVTWSWTTGGSTKLSVEKIIELGFQFNVTYTDSSTFTFTDIPPNTGLWDIPYTLSDKVFFTSTKEEYVCGALVGDQRCQTRWFYRQNLNYTDHWWRYVGDTDRMVERPLGEPPDA
jgi:hypothetical protein